MRSLAPLTACLFPLIGLIDGCALNRSGEPHAVPSRPITSSYECRMEPVAGLLTKGEGAYGCYFYLLAAGTDRVRGNTPYLLQIYAPRKTPSDKKTLVVELLGVTDEQGRSEIVRAPFPIVPNLVRFVEVIGTGPYNGSGSIHRGTDGEPVPNVLYYYNSCNGQSIGLTDEQGHTPLFKTKESCKYEVTFAACRGKNKCTEEDVTSRTSKQPQGSQ